MGPTPPHLVLSLREKNSPTNPHPPFSQLTSSSDSNTGVGNMGTCCAEGDTWGANSKATAYMPRPCTDNTTPYLRRRQLR
ncbi:hypothetical protein VUR80DRAFT_10116 [Thermomyces stellatus]